MAAQTWKRVDAYFEAMLVSQDAALLDALERSRAAGLPAHQVAPNQGKLLALFARMIDARRVLEIGTLGGYSTIWLARALVPGGKVISLEANALHAGIAAQNIAAAGLAHCVEIMLGPALETLSLLAAENAAPFDLIFIDADKPNNPHYLDWAVKLARPGSIIIGDNVVRDGAVADPHSADPSVQGVQRFFERMQAHPRLEATALQTVGAKGYDGFSIARVID